MIRKITLFFLAGLLLFTVSGTARAYEDVPNDSPYFYAVEFLRRANVISDKTERFNPDLVITRAEFIKYLVRLNNRDFKEKPTAKLPFKDTTENGWYAAYFEEALNQGILSDRDENAYPYRKLTMTDALELLFHSKSIPIPKRHVGKILFKDVARNKTLAPLIMRANQMEVAEPVRGDYFGMFRKVTRAEAAQMIYKMELVEVAPPKFVTESQTEEVKDFRLQKILTAWDLLHRNFLERDKVDGEKLTDAAIRGMMETLEDPYSVYMNKDENTAFTDDLDGEIEGIGAVIGFNEAKQISVVTPMADSPAQRAGVKAGDVILKVNGKEIKDLGLNEAVRLIKGPKGTTVNLEILRGNLTMNLAVVRDVIKVNGLTYEVKEDDIMVIRLLQFSMTAPREFLEVAQIIRNNPKIKGIVLDLRDNPGGLLDASVKILNLFLKPQSAVVKIKYSSYVYTQFATGTGELGAYPIVVLINKGSASASEIVAGALKDYGIATVMGEKSFGKGTVQEVNYFRDNSSLKLTIAKWLTPLGHSIQDNGIEPDIAVSEPGAQMSEALLQIRKMINEK